MTEKLNGELWDASRAGDIDRVMSLIERGADIHSGHCNDSGYTALHYACARGRTAVASLLLERGVDIHSRDDDGHTALHRACARGRTAVASLLIERGADIDSRNGDRRTALHRACYHGHKDIAILLIESKADIYIKRYDGQTPLDFMPEWRKELTELYNTVNRAWLARKSLLFVLIGCGHVEGVSGGGEPVEEMEQSAHERLRDEVLRSVNMSIMSYL
jgi:ankyrin repeat protein